MTLPGFPLIVTAPDVDVKAPPERTKLVVFSVKLAFAKTPPLTVSVVVTTMLLPRVTVPPVTVRFGNVFCVANRVIVPVALNVYELPAAVVHVEPAPDVFHDPAMVHGPVVTIIVPDVPPVIATEDTPTVEAPALRMPPLPMFSEPPAS